MDDKMESFIRAFSDHTSGFRRKCACGCEFYDEGYDGEWDVEEGEIEELEKAGAKPLDHAAAAVCFEGKEYVIDCGCWQARAKHLMAWIDDHASEIAEYLTLEKKRKLDEARESPTVKESV